jgi:hypothetical protein
VRSGETFTAALEQAEQYLRAADEAGYPTKPVQLFYALSQPSRAICAARSGEPWLITGHGASVETHLRVADTTVTPHRGGALPMVAQATGSALWEGPVTVSDLWSSLPELASIPLDPRAIPALALEPDPDVYGQALPPGLHEAFSSRGGLRTELWPGDHADLEERVAQALARYPAGRTASIAGSHIASTIEQLVWLTWVQVENGQRIFTPIEVVAEPHGGLFYLRPGLGANETIPTKLVTWWGILLALSSLARYEPVAWRKALDIDRAATADALERALDDAATRLPSLVLEALTS